MRRKFLCFLLLACFVGIAPVHAQGVTPTPIPPSSTELQILREIAQRLETMSANDATTANAGVLLLGLGFVILMLAGLIVAVWVARGGLKPMADTIHSERQRALTAEQSETRLQTQNEDKERQLQEMRTQQAQALQTTAVELGKVATTMSGMETGEQAKQGRTNAIKAVTDHSTDEHNRTRQDIKKVSDKLDKVLRILARGDKSADPDIAEAQAQLIEAKREVIKMGTDELDPAHVPDTDPAAPQEPDIWTQDNPPNLPPETE